MKYTRAIGSNTYATTTDSDLYLSDRWQVLEERAAVTQVVTTSFGGSSTSTFGRTDQQVWGLGYVDDLVLRDRAPTGTVDVNMGGFGPFGRATTDFGGGTGRTDVARAVVVQPNGKVVAAGSSTASGGGSSDLALARYTSSGSLDTSFDTDGRVQSSLGTVEGWSAAVLETDAQIVVGGYTTNGGGGTNLVLARYNANGTLDTAFDTDGFVVTVVSSGDDYVRGVVVQPDGKIVAVGDSVDGSGRRVITVARYTAAGVLDTTFSGDGIATATAGTGAAYGNAVALQPDGKIVVAGYAAGSTSGTDMVALRFNADGTLDDGSGSDTTSGDSFGTSGVATVDVALVTGGNDHAYAVALSPDGTVVLAGDAADASSTYLAVARLTAAGTTDTTFGPDLNSDGNPDGRLTGSTAGSEARAVAVDGLGRITAAGSAGATGTGTGVDFALVRVWADGTYDTGFGASGQVGTDVGGSSADDRAYALALTVSGAVAAGSSGGDFGVAVYQPTGTPAPQRLYALRDANHNVTALVTSGGSVAERFRYDPYGASTVLSSSFTATTDGYDWAYRHQGGRLEFATGAYHFRFRDYDPALGRWLTEDPSGYPDGANRYLGVLSNPVKLTDPMGLAPPVYPWKDDNGVWHPSVYPIPRSPSAPATQPAGNPPSQADLDALERATSRQQNCMAFATSQHPKLGNQPTWQIAVSAGTLDQTVVNKLNLTDDNEFFNPKNRIILAISIDAMVKKFGGRPGNKGDPTPPGMHRIDVFVYKKIGIPIYHRDEYDHHWIVQCANGKFLQKHGQKPGVDETTVRDQILSGKIYVGTWFLPGDPFADPRDTVKK